MPTSEQQPTTAVVTGGARGIGRALAERLAADGHAGTRGGVGGVLGQLDQQPVAVPAADQVLLGVGVLAEPRRGVGPRREHAAAQARGVEGVGHEVSMAARGPSGRVPTGPSGGSRGGRGTGSPHRRAG